MSRSATKVYLSLGSNIGDSREYIEEMVVKLTEVLTAVRTSPIYETDPIGVDNNHTPYSNCIVEGEYYKSAESLLEYTEQTEIALGRTHKGELTPRTADIDILLFGDEVIESASLTVPHHALLDRYFHVRGLLTLNPTLQIPMCDTPLADILLPLEVRSQRVQILQEVSQCK